MQPIYERFMTSSDPDLTGAKWVPTYNSTSDVWNFKNSAGQILFTITIDYTDSTKATILDITRS